MCQLDFIDWFLDLEEYFIFWKICDEEKVWLASNKLDDEAEEWCVFSLGFYDISWY